MSAAARSKIRSAVSLAFTKYGEASDLHRKPLVIAHGLFGQKQNWNSVSKALQRRLGNQIFAVDMRNHGESPHAPTMEYDEMAGDLVKFIEDVVLPSTSGKFSSVHLLGHSMGGKAAMSLALAEEMKHLVDRLIVEDVSPSTMNKVSHSHFPHYIRAMKTADLTLSRKMIGEYLAPVVKDLPTRQFLLTNLAPGNNGSRLKWKLNLDAIEEFLSHITSTTLSQGTFEGPAMFQSGARSDYITPEDHPVIKKLFPMAEFDVIANAGHWLHAEQPKLFMESVVRFIEAGDS
uniref:sn-1-specific diacylglycerol lipase ABHD11 n=2 Tax=Steinernema glaseri TaxID=37863 RepID=A0A1I7Y700_9BILA